MTGTSNLFTAARLSRRRVGALTAAGVAGLAAPALLRRGDARAQTSDAPFVIANEAEPASLLPWFGGFGAALVSRQIYETLVEPRMELNDAGEIEINWVGVLAESWERVDDLRWRFYLRRGVTFHNGEPWNADAAVASAQVLGDTELTNRLGTINLIGRAVAAVEKVDDYTFDMETPGPNSEFLSPIVRLGYVGLPAGALAEQGVEAFAEAPIGTGPFRFGSWSRGQEIILERSDDYWGEASSFPSLRYVTRPEAAVRAQTIAAGEAHFAFNIGAQQGSTLDRSVTGAGFQSTSIRINNTIAPTNDHRVRLAINHAIDRQGIVDAIFNGQAVPAAFFGFQPVTLEPYTYDPELARSLIEEAGAGGTELELVYGEGRIPEEDQLAEIYQAALQDIGLVIKLTKVEPVQYNEIGGRAFEEQPPLYMETTSSGNYAEIISGLQDKYGSEGSGAYRNPDLDAAFLSLYVLDGEEKWTRLQEIAEQLHAEAPRAWVAVIPQVHGLGPNVATDFPLNAYVRIQDIGLQ